jgi:hypothetical protein
MSVLKNEKQKKSRRDDSIIEVKNEKQKNPEGMTVL